MLWPSHCNCILIFLRGDKNKMAIITKVLHSLRYVPAIRFGPDKYAMKCAHYDNKDVEYSYKVITVWRTTFRVQQQGYEGYQLIRPYQKPLYLVGAFSKWCNE